jgi:hypothetical protein
VKRFFRPFTSLTRSLGQHSEYLEVSTYDCTEMNS